MLKDYQIGPTSKRNYRGFLPRDLVHKRHKIQDPSAIDDEPDYLFVVSKKRASFLVDQLREMGLNVKQFQSVNKPSHLVLVIYFPDELLDQMGELLEVDVRLLNFNRTYPFKNHADDLYESFNAREKHLIMLKIFEQEIDLDYYQKIGIIKEHFPLHDPHREDIEDSWNRYRTRLFFGFITGSYLKSMQPLNFIANYYGEKLGFYFAWLTFYTSWLLIPAVPGIVLFAYQLINMFAL